MRRYWAAWGLGFMLDTLRPHDDKRRGGRTAYRQASERKLSGVRQDVRDRARGTRRNCRFTLRSSPRGRECHRLEGAERLLLALKIGEHAFHLRKLPLQPLALAGDQLVERLDAVLE